ncbi:hypothetical protein [Nocardioides alcanivorans]|uniref:hypothetical protein n=1 Tax=Nocardioides alcanivorans TaxID=2897352 RepID=UPI001F435E7F|nr:hypothetical protein [Nocardioides alcanivorans]
MALHTAPPGGSPRDALPLQINELKPRGVIVQVHDTGLDGTRLAADLTAAVLTELAPVPACVRRREGTRGGHLSGLTMLSEKGSGPVGARSGQ